MYSLKQEDFRLDETHSRSIDITFAQANKQKLHFLFFLLKGGLFLFYDFNYKL